jgi:hypothetical protein
MSGNDSNKIASRVTILMSFHYSKLSSTGKVYLLLTGVRGTEGNFWSHGLAVADSVYIFPFALSVESSSSTISRSYYITSTLQESLFTPSFSCRCWFYRHVHKLGNHWVNFTVTQRWKQKTWVREGAKANLTSVFRDEFGTNFLDKYYLQWPQENQRHKVNILKVSLIL